MRIHSKKLFRPIFRQNMIIRQWGALKQSAGQIGIYVTIVNTVMIGTTLYSTGWIQENIIQIRFAPFMAVLFGLIMLLLLLAWKMDVPSFFSSWNDQFWNHGNQMRGYLEEQFGDLSEKVSLLAKEVEELKKEANGNDNRTEGD